MVSHSESLKMQSSFCSLVVALALPAATAWGEGHENSRTRWAEFRGAGSQGIAAAGMKLPSAFGPSDKILWKTSLPQGHSSPCIWDDRVFVTGFDGRANKLETIALDRQSGTILWRRTISVKNLERMHELNNPASSTPATDGDQVYVYFGSFGLLCYDRDGNPKWQRPLEPIYSYFGSGTSPVVMGEFVLLNSGQGRGKFLLLALDRRTGKTVWQKERPRGFATGLWSTPVVRHTPSGAEVLVAGGGQVASYGLADGSPRWRVDGLPLISLNTPAVTENAVVLTLTNPIGDADNVIHLPRFEEALRKFDKNRDGKISREELPADMMVFTRGRADKIGDWSPLRNIMASYDRDKDGALNREEWQALVQFLASTAANVQIAVVSIRLDGKPDVGKPHIAWKQTKSVPEVPSPLCYEGRVYLVTEKGILTCRDVSTGKEIYRERLTVRGSCYASPVVGDKKIYVASDGGTVVVLKPGDRFEVLAKNEFNEGIKATPALVDSKIYLRTERHMFAIGE
jgi:outer membrane protein assembly factor BamB